VNREPFSHIYTLKTNLQIKRKDNKFILFFIYFENNSKILSIFAISNKEFNLIL